MWPFRDPPFQDPPFWDPEKQKVGPNCNFFSIADCRITLNLKYRRKSAGNQSCDDSFPLYGNKKESPIEKKLQGSPISCFCNERIAPGEPTLRKMHGSPVTEWANRQKRGASNACLRGIVCIKSKASHCCEALLYWLVAPRSVGVSAVGAAGA